MVVIYMLANTIRVPLSVPIVWPELYKAVCWTTSSCTMIF